MKKYSISLDLYFHAESLETADLDWLIEDLERCNSDSMAKSYARHVLALLSELDLMGEKVFVKNVKVMEK